MVANCGIVVAVQRVGANMVSVATFALQAEQLRVEGGIPTEATARSRDGHHCLGIDGDLIHADEVARASESVVREVSEDVDVGREARGHDLRRGSRRLRVVGVVDISSRASEGKLRGASACESNGHQAKAKSTLKAERNTAVAFRCSGHC